MSDIPEKELPEFSHFPVMLNEVLEGLVLQPAGFYFGGTAGGAGRSSAIASRLSERGRLIAIDRDSDAVAVASERLSVYGGRAVTVHANYSDMKRVCAELGIEAVDGFLLDLGVSSYQLDNPMRGFSYLADAPLSMKMDESDVSDARSVVNGYSYEELCRILWDWGEEKFARKIASAICREREKKPIETTLELVSVIRSALPDGGKSQKHHFAMRTFQAIRIEVNREIEIIPDALRDAVSLLKPGGRGAVITFHSIEDRAVKEAFADMAVGCVCPKSLPVCVCGRIPVIRQISRKPILPSATELGENTRSHSAKLRVVEKCFPATESFIK
ncbi:MAG: 16S rRNA (cytosine(1402)-N(4))-methyltransferase RsmH [Clostridia bacterium]|nr:16S rRNA (cytosine(1402)-N(4))-methyltransferase RsmH [Clostridia bacterium]